MVRKVLGVLDGACTECRIPLQTALSLFPGLVSQCLKEPSWSATELGNWVKGEMARLPVMQPPIFGPAAGPAVMGQHMYGWPAPTQQQKGWVMEGLGTARGAGMARGRMGFGSRLGANQCRVCGREGHWARDCTIRDQMPDGGGMSMSANMTPIGGGAMSGRARH